MTAALVWNELPFFGFALALPIKALSLQPS
jgi:hypothetical protein